MSLDLACPVFIARINRCTVTLFVGVVSGKVPGDLDAATRATLLYTHPTQGVRFTPDRSLENAEETD